MNLTYLGRQPQSSLREEQQRVRRSPRSAVVSSYPRKGTVELQQENPSLSQVCTTSYTVCLVWLCCKSSRSGKELSRSRPLAREEARDCETSHLYPTLPTLGLSKHLLNLLYPSLSRAAPSGSARKTRSQKAYALQKSLEGIPPHTTSSLRRTWCY